MKKIEENKKESIKIEIKWCRKWDLNPRTSTRPGPEPGAVDRAWLSLLIFLCNKALHPVVILLSNAFANNTIKYYQQLLTLSMPYL